MVYGNGVTATAVHPITGERVTVSDTNISRVMRHMWEIMECEKTRILNAWGFVGDWVSEAADNKLEFKDAEKHILERYGYPVAPMKGRLMPCEKSPHGVRYEYPEDPALYPLSSFATDKWRALIFEYGIFALIPAAAGWNKALTNSKESLRAAKIYRLD